MDAAFNKIIGNAKVNHTLIGISKLKNSKIPYVFLVLFSSVIYPERTVPKMRGFWFETIVWLCFYFRWGTVHVLGLCNDNMQERN